MPQTTSTGQILDLFEKHYEDLYCHLRRYTTPRETEQLCRQTFNELVSGEMFGSIEPNRVHLFKVAEYLIRERYRPLRRIASALARLNTHGDWKHDEELDRPASGASTSTRLLRKMEREMRQLPGDLCQAIVLLFGQQIPLHAASMQMGVSEELLDKWATHGLRRLTQRMYSHGN